MPHAAHWKWRTQKIAKIRRLGTVAQLYRPISSQLSNVSTIGKLLNSNVSPTCPHNMVNFGPLTAEICWRVWGTPANFNGFRILAALLHGIVVVDVIQTLRRWTEGATYIPQGDHHVGHWPTFLVFYIIHWLFHRSTPFGNWYRTLNIQLLVIVTSAHIGLIVLTFYMPLERKRSSRTRSCQPIHWHGTDSTILSWHLLWRWRRRWTVASSLFSPSRMR